MHNRIDIDHRGLSQWKSGRMSAPHSPQAEQMNLGGTRRNCEN
jgi:hypothetical protein